jgi:hypothetical protein
VLDGVPPGPLHVIAIIGADRLRVSAIEPLRGDPLAAPALQRRFPSAAITEQLLEVSHDHPSPALASNSRGSPRSSC